MNKFLQLNPTGRWSWGRAPTIELDGQGLVLLQGLNLDRGPQVRIGAGKSSLFNALCEILYGESMSELKGEAAVNSVWGRGAWGLVVFEDTHGTKWRVINCRGWRAAEPYPDHDVETQPSQLHAQGKRYSGTEVFLERWDETAQKWMDERPTNAGGTAQLRQKLCYTKVTQVLGMTFQQFTATSYVAQQKTSRFLTGTHKERLQVLSELIDLSIWDRACARARELAAEAERQVTVFQTQVAMHRDALAKLQAPSEEEIYQIDASLTEANEQVATAARLLDETTTQLSSLTEKLQAGLSTDRELRQRHHAHLLYVSQCENTLKSGASEFAQRRGEAQRQVSSVALDSAQARLQEARRQVAVQRQHIGSLLEGEGKCPRCWQQVTKTHLDRERRIATEELEKLREAMEQAEADVVAASQAFEAEAKAALDAVTEQERKWREDVSLKLLEAQRNCDAAAAAVRQFEASREQDEAVLRQLQNDQTRYRNMNIEAVSKLSVLQRRADSVADILQRQQQIEVEMKAAEDQLATNTEKTAYYRAIEKMFGDKGIKAYQMGKLVDQLNAELAKHLNILTDGQVQAWVDAFRHKKDGDITADISINVREGAKESVAVGGYSGGEKEQISMAFTCAFLSLATNGGTGTNILLLDEAFTALDEYSVGAAMSLVDSIMGDRVTTTIMVSHDPKIVNIANINKTWTAVKSGGITRLESA